MRVRVLFSFSQPPSPSHTLMLDRNLHPLFTLKKKDVISFEYSLLLIDVNQSRVRQTENSFSNNYWVNSSFIFPLLYLTKAHIQSTSVGGIMAALGPCASEEKEYSTGADYCFNHRFYCCVSNGIIRIV